MKPLVAALTLSLSLPASMALAADAPAAKVAPAPAPAPAAAAAPAGAMDVVKLLTLHDAAMAPAHWTGVFRMTATREDGSKRGYLMKLASGSSTQTRIWFQEPAAVRGQEILRQGDNAWLYLPSLKRGIRLASRDSFQGGDFNNADVLRGAYLQDYTAELAPKSEREGTFQIELKAKTADASYDHVTLFLSPEGLPVAGRYGSASGKLLRTAEFSDVKAFGQVKRPARIVMTNALVPARSSELLVESLDPAAEPASSLFVLDALGR